MIIFDTETTSLDAKTGQIAQLSYVKVNEENNKIEFAKNFYFSVDKMSYEAEQVNKLSKKLLKELSNEKRFEDFSDEIYEDFKSENLIIAHNVDFDKRFLLEEFKRVGKDISIFLEKEYFCTMLHYEDILNIYHSYYITKFPKLQEIVQYLKIDKEELMLKTREIFNIDNCAYHDARFDVVATFIIYQYKDFDFAKYDSFKNIYYDIERLEDMVKNLKAKLIDKRLDNVTIKDLSIIDEFREYLVESEGEFESIESLTHHSLEIINNMNNKIISAKEEVLKAREQEFKMKIEKALNDEDAKVRKAVILEEYNFNKLYQQIIFDIQLDYCMRNCNHINVDLVQMNKTEYIMFNYDKEKAYVIEVDSEVSRFKLDYELGKDEYKVISMKECPATGDFPQRSYEVMSHETYLNLPYSYFNRLNKEEQERRNEKEEQSKNELDYDDEIPF